MAHIRGVGGLGVVVGRLRVGVGGLGVSGLRVGGLGARAGFWVWWVCWGGVLVGGGGGWEAEGGLMLPLRDRKQHCVFSR